MEGLLKRIKTSVHIELAIIVFLAHVLEPGTAGADDSGHAPCYDCEMFNVMQQDHPVHKRQVSLDK